MPFTHASAQQIIPGPEKQFVALQVPAEPAESAEPSEDGEPPLLVPPVAFEPADPPALPVAFEPSDPPAPPVAIPLEPPIAPPFCDNELSEVVPPHATTMVAAIASATVMPGFGTNEDSVLGECRIKWFAHAATTT